MTPLNPEMRHMRDRRRRPAIPFLMAFALAAFPTGAWRAHAQEGATGTSFVDNFDTLDASRWYVSDGWNNGNFQNCTWSKDEVGVSDGRLKLRYVKQETKDRHYACGEIQTRKKFGYGTYEARLKAVSGNGLNSAFFSYIGPAQKEPWDEIDFEILGKDPSRVQLNQYVGGKGHNEKLVDVTGGADQAFHDYAFVWEKDRLRYFLDGKLIETVTDPAKIPTHAQKIFFSLWGSDTLGSWMGKFEEPSSPPIMEVERVSFTAPGDPCPFPGSVACSP